MTPTRIPLIVTAGAVAPIGARTAAGKIRRRRYRGVDSFGMLCSLVELGWIPVGPDEVAVLADVEPGARL